MIRPIQKKIYHYLSGPTSIRSDQYFADNSEPYQTYSSRDLANLCSFRDIAAESILWFQILKNPSIAMTDVANGFPLIERSKRGLNETHRSFSFLSLPLSEQSWRYRCAFGSLCYIGLIARYCLIIFQVLYRRPDDQRISPFRTCEIKGVSNWTALRSLETCLPWRRGYRSGLIYKVQLEKLYEPKFWRTTRKRRYSQKPLFHRWKQSPFIVSYEYGYSFDSWIAFVREIISEYPFHHLHLYIA
jgi:hypothetical protein